MFLTTTQFYYFNTGTWFFEGFLFAKCIVNNDEFFYSDFAHEMMLRLLPLITYGARACGVCRALL